MIRNQTQRLLKKIEVIVLETDRPKCPQSLRATAQDLSTSLALLITSVNPSRISVQLPAPYA